MKVMFSGIINDATGKLGDIVAAHNRYGSFFRTWRSTPASGSAYWIAIRDQSIIITRSWNNLTDYQRKLWNEASKEFRRTDRLGNEFLMSGQNLYCSCNINRWFCGFGTLSEPPAYAAIPLFDTFSGSASVSGTSFDITFSPAIQVGKSVKLWVTSSLSIGINRPYAQYRMLDVVDDTFLSGDSIYAQFIARFPGGLTAGNRIFLKSFQVDQATGLQGQPSYSSIIVSP